MAAKAPHHKKKNYGSYGTYVYKVLKQVHPDTGISGPALESANQLVHFTLKKIMKHVNVVKTKVGVSTVSTALVKSGLQLCLPGELLKHSIAEGTKAVAKYQVSTLKKSSAAARAGLQFPPARVSKEMRSVTAGCKCRLTAGAPIFLAAVLEYLVAEVLELAGNISRDMKKVRIISRHLSLAVSNDEELEKFYKGFVFSSGVMPSIHSVLLPPKTASGKTKRPSKKTAKPKKAAPKKKAAAKKRTTKK